MIIKALIIKALIAKALIVKALNASRPAGPGARVASQQKDVFFPKRLQWKIHIYFASTTLASIPWEGFR